MMYIFFALLVLFASSARAAVIRHQSPDGTTAYSHQSITHILTEAEPRILTTPQLSLSSNKVVFPADTEAKEADKFLTTQVVVTDSPHSEGSYITYKDKVPILNSPVHTPAHLTYSAQPVIYHTLPMIEPAPYISYSEFKAGHRNKDHL